MLRCDIMFSRSKLCLDVFLERKLSKYINETKHRKIEPWGIRVSTPIFTEDDDRRSWHGPTKASLQRPN